MNKTVASKCKCTVYVPPGEWVRGGGVPGENSNAIYMYIV